MERKREHLKWNHSAPQRFIGYKQAFLGRTDDQVQLIFEKFVGTTETSLPVMRTGYLIKYEVPAIPKPFDDFIKGFPAILYPAVFKIHVSDIMPFSFQSLVQMHQETGFPRAPDPGDGNDFLMLWCGLSDRYRSYVGTGLLVLHMHSILQRHPRVSCNIVLYQNNLSYYPDPVLFVYSLINFCPVL